MRSLFQCDLFSVSSNNTPSFLFSINDLQCTRSKPCSRKASIVMEGGCSWKTSKIYIFLFSFSVVPLVNDTDETTGIWYHWEAFCAIVNETVFCIWIASISLIITPFFQLVVQCRSGTPWDLPVSGHVLHCVPGVVQRHPALWPRVSRHSSPHHCSLYCCIMQVKQAEKGETANCFNKL